ncbi:aminomethyl-transferring glycine dehydrogenase subunit GcvPA [bacterium]|nr:aminomethyl-transferring glycine dehydrogenase subunit GcvPA [bacterium]
MSNTDEERATMLAELGLNSIEELFKDIPSELMSYSFNLPTGKSELEVRHFVKGLASKNVTDLICFLGGGFYDHFVPAAVGAITSRSEFYTAYTPYQAEVSQGILQSIYEYQSAISLLTEMDITNASLYDGGTAICEAVMMAVRITRRKKIIIDEAVSPIYRKILHSYAANLDFESIDVPVGKDGRADRKIIESELDNNAACLVLQNPNFFGCIDDLTDLADLAHKSGSLVILSTYPISLGVLKSPGEMNVDIATGEGQSLGLGLCFGGPYLGLMTTRSKYVRQMPGRIVGETVDKNGSRGFVLTLQTREQHIRREKATSNICSNEALCALAALVYLTLVGKHGLRELAELCSAKASYARERLLKIPVIKQKFESPIFNEFVLELPIDAEDVVSKLMNKKIMAGLPLGHYYKNMKNCMLVALSEKRTKKEIDFFVESLGEIL